jgi:hypothetical protein
VLTQSVIAYSTAERTASLPGWRANNDLWLLDVSAEKPKPVELVAANTQGLYPWWGTTFTWSPDGTQLAYARADQIGVIRLAVSDTITASLTPLVDFAPVETFSDWVWVPGLSWSPDSQFVAAVVHGPPLAGESPEESQVFDLWLFGVDGTISARVMEQAGMWANPVWGDAGIAFGEALNPLQSVNSRYTIQLIDRDGSNKRQLFPLQEQTGVQFPELVWSSSNQLLFVFNGNLYLTSDQGSPPRQLTVNSQAGQPQWISVMPIITGTTGLTTSDTINATATTVSVTPTITVTPVLSATATPTVTATATQNSSIITPTLTPTSTIETAKDAD